MAVLKRFVTLLQVATPSRGINGQDERCISCGAVDSTARSCFMGNQGGQAPSVLALPFKSRDNGNRIFGTFCPISRGRRTRDGGLYTCWCSLKTNGIFVPVYPVSRASRYNTLHLASKVVCQRGHKPPLETPGFVSAWPQIAFLHLCPHPIQNLKKRRRSAYEWWAGLRHFFIRPVGRNETRCIWRIVFPG